MNVRVSIGDLVVIGEPEKETYSNEVAVIVFENLISHYYVNTMAHIL